MSGEPPKPNEPFVAGRARGRGRGLYQHPKPFDPDHPGQKREPWSLTQGGPRPPPPIPGRTFMSAGRGTPFSDPSTGLSSVSDSAGGGRGVKLSGPSSGSDKREKRYPEGRPDAMRGRIREEVKIPERLLYTRPDKIESKVGTSGQPITCEANYFRLLTKPDWQLFAYRVDFKPDVEDRRFRNFLVGSQRQMIGGYLFDGTQLFCSQRLEADLIEKTVTGRTGEAILVTFKYTRSVSMTEEQSQQILNLILRRCMAGLEMQLIGRNYFDKDAKIELRQLRLELWPGYVTSIRQHEEEILMCAEVSHKVMRRETVLELMEGIRRVEHDFTAKCRETVLGMTVLTDYNNNTYRIDDILFDARPTDTFTRKDGTEISYIDYYQTRYNLRINNPMQPMLVSNPKAKDVRGLQGGEARPVLLVPELCRCTGITDTMKSDFRAMKEMATHTRVGPQKRIEQLLAFNNRLTTCQNSAAVLREWNLELDRELVKIPARVLPPPNILFGNERKVPTDKRADWTSAFRDNSLFHSIELKRWFVIATPNAMGQTEMFVQALQKASNGMRFHIANPKIRSIPDDRQLSISKAIEECAVNNPQMIMCVVTNNNADRYAVVKKKCYIEFGLPSQVMVLRTITPKDKSRGIGGLLSVATKVAIQMNAKLGGIPWMIEMPLNGLMTIGYDVCHDPKDKSKSWGAVVATMDLKKRNTEFFSAVNPHSSGQELSNHLAMNVAKALKQFHDINGALPERIMFFRDGVGEGQMKYVAEHEVEEIKKKLHEIYQKSDGYLNEDKQVQFSFIVVTKRINTRIFFGRQNPEPGTCVDDIITLPERYDFFVVPQSVREGTVSPTGFNVISDTMGLPPDRLQILAYRFCFFYYNWSGTVRVPAPCQYAHKLAFLASQSIRNAPHPDLERKLFYL